MDKEKSWMDRCMGGGQTIMKYNAITMEGPICVTIGRNSTYMVIHEVHCTCYPMVQWIVGWAYIVWIVYPKYVGHGKNN